MESLGYIGTRALAWAMGIGIAAFIVHINRPFPPPAPTDTNEPMWP